MVCNGCQNPYAYKVQVFQTETGSFAECCDRCGGFQASGTVDVYYPYGSGVHTEENIADPKTGQPIPFSSKREKWEAMRKAGVHEAADSHHGARPRSDMHSSSRKKYFI